MQIRDLTISEADYLQAVCNFTKEEDRLFELRLQDIPLEDCAEIMHLSIATVKRLSAKVNAKIKREI